MPYFVHYYQVSYRKSTGTLSEAINDRIETVPRTIDGARIVREAIT